MHVSHPTHVTPFCHHGKAHNMPLRLNEELHLSNMPHASLTSGVLLLDPPSGKVRMNYEWKFQGYRALQPTVVGDDVILLPTPMSEGTRAIRIRKKGDQLVAEELWTSKHMKPDFTELIAHKGHLYGIDGSMFTCVDLKTGTRSGKMAATARASHCSLIPPIRSRSPRKTVASSCSKPIPPRTRRSHRSRRLKARPGIIR
jgi:hypothetical protein